MISSNLKPIYLYTFQVIERTLKALKSLPDEVSCPLGGDAFFEIILDGSHAEPVWCLNGEEIKEGKDNVTFEETPLAEGTAYRMTLSDRQVVDSGSIAFTALGGQCKQVAELVVKDLPLGFTRELQDTVGKEFGHVEFEALVTRKNCITTWFVNGEPLRPSDKFQVLSTGFTRKVIVADLDADADNFVITCELSDGPEKAETAAKLETSMYNAFVSSKCYMKNRIFTDENVFFGNFMEIV